MAERVITLFGEPKAVVDGEPVELGPAWPLLAVLILWRQPRPIRMADVVDRLTPPNSLADDPGSRFRKHKQIVQTLLKMEPLEGQSLAEMAGALLAHAWVDAALFDEKIESADSEQVREAIQLRQRGPLLAGRPALDFVENERAMRERKYQNALWRLIQEDCPAHPQEALRHIELLSNTGGLPPARVEVLQEMKLTLEHELLRRNQSAGDGVKPTSPFKPLGLPCFPTELIGREKEAVAIRELLAAPGLVTLTGTAGIGKTRLAIAVAGNLREDAAYGVGFADLTTTGAGQLAQQTGLSLGLKEETGRNWREALLAFLADRRILLVWDNCDHLVQACADLATEILAKCPSVRLLATSREPIRAYGEKRYPVPLLSLPEQGTAATPEAASEHEAPRLFAARAQAVCPDFRLTTRNSPTVLRLCRDLDGLPLAIELAATLTDTWTLEQIAAELHERFDLLVDGPLAGVPRHRSLRAAFDVSYDLLEPAEQELFGHLSVFAGGFSVEAAQAVAVSEKSPELGLSAAFLLPRLVRKSLVIAEEQAGEMRFQCLETVRQYAEHRLREKGEDSAARRRHAAWFLHLAEEAEPYLTRGNQKQWLDRLEMELDNLRAAMTWYKQQKQGNEACLRLAGALSDFWRVRGYLNEGRQWLVEGLQAEAHVPTPVRADSLNALGTLALLQGDFGAAQSWGEESLRLSREIEDKKGIGKALHGLGNVAFYQGKYHIAREQYEECLELFRQAGDKKRAADALNNLGSTALYEGDLEAAQDRYEEGLRLFQEAGDAQGVRKVSHNLGNVAFYQGRYATARQRYEECLELLRDIGDERDRAYALNNLASAALPLGDYQQVRAALVESLTLFQKIGDQQGLCYVLAGLASLAAARNQGEQAARLWGAAEMLRELIGAALHQSDRDTYDQEVSAVGKVLGEAAFASAWAEGRGLTWAQVVAFALETYAL